jgi:hypothetical protein
MARVGRELRPKRPRMESAARAKAGSVTPAATGPPSRSARAPGRAAKPAKARPRAGAAAARAGAGRARLRLPRFGVRSPVWGAGVVLPIVVALLALDGPAVEPAADPSLDRPGAVTVTDSPGPPGAPLALRARESAGSGPRLVTLGGVPPRSRDEGPGGGANGEVDGAPNKGAPAPAPTPAPAPAPGGGGGGGSDGGGGGGDGGGDGAGGGCPPPPPPRRRPTGRRRLSARQSAPSPTRSDRSSRASCVRKFHRGCFVDRSEALFAPVTIRARKRGQGSWSSQSRSIRYGGAGAGWRRWRSSPCLPP